MSFIKTYFLCPTSDFIQPPPTGPLSLGSIIRSTSAPQHSLNKFNVLTVTEQFPPVIETDWKKSISSEHGLELGIYAQFLQLATAGFPVGSELDVKRNNKVSSVFAFDKVTTLAFEPSSEYVAEAMRAPAIQTWLKEPKQRFAINVSLFLVTGIKLVSGAKIKYSVSRSSAITGNLGIDIPSSGTTFGPKGSWTGTDEDESEFNRASEFVFAFRVKRIKVGRKSSTEDYNKGAFMAVGDKNDEGTTILIEDVDGSKISAAKATVDITDGGILYCVPPST